MTSSKRDPFAQPTPLLDESAFNAFVDGFRFGFADNTIGQSETTWSIYPSDTLRALISQKLGFDYRLNRPQGLPAAILFEMTPSLKETIENRCIYPVSKNEYFFEAGNRGIYVRYQRIIGSRLVGYLSDEQLDYLATQMAAGYKLLNPTPSPVAEQAVIRTEIIELKMLQVDGQKIILPKEQLKFYADIKAKMQKAGGKYSSRGYFSFPDGIDAASVLQDLLLGKEVNSKKVSQSFFSPPAIALQVVSAVPALKAKRVLEPSAGHGALADLVVAEGAEVVTVENHAPNVIALEKKGYTVERRDFLSVTPDAIGLFDAIVANPPFSRNQDIKHVMHMLNFLKPGGTLSVIMSQSWMHGSQPVQKRFRDLLDSLGASIREIPAGAFKESGTTVATVHVVIKDYKFFNPL